MPAFTPDLSTAQEIAARVRARRKYYRITQVQLAELSGLSDKTVRDIEHGTGTPSLAAVIAVLAVVGLRLDIK